MFSFDYFREDDMGKRIRLDENEPAKLKLQTNKVDLGDIKERANRGRGKHQRVEFQIMSADKGIVVKLIEDFESMTKRLKKLGVKVEYELHHSETSEWKKSMSKPIKEKDVPTFLKKGK